MLHGIDISHWQGTPNLPALKAKYGLTFLGVKATEGNSYTDPRFDANWGNAKAAGLVRVAYHFARPEQSSAASQARRLVDRAGTGGLLCLDLEASNLSQAMTNRWAVLFGDQLRVLAPAATTVLYMGSGYAGNDTGRDLSRYFDYWWYPRYPSSAVTSRFPSSFTPRLGANHTGWPRPHIWQFTAWLKGGYDGNVSWLSVDQLRGTPTPPLPAPTPDWVKHLMAQLPVRRRGDHDKTGPLYVHRIQGLCTALGHKVGIDGDFGAVTEAAVKAVQKGHGVKADGVVDQDTWTVLVTGGVL